jgi:hypothetical protein
MGIHIRESRSPSERRPLLVGLDRAKSIPAFANFYKSGVGITQKPACVASWSSDQPVFGNLQNQAQIDWLAQVQADYPDWDHRN